MYKFDIFALTGIIPTASAVAAGIENGMFIPSTVCEYEEWAMSAGLSEGNNELLIFEGNADDAISALRNTGRITDDNGWRTLRCAVLSSLEGEGEQLPDEIERVYADFNYPEDMEQLVYYMPPSEDEPIGTDALINKFRLFLAKEREALDSQ